MKQISNLPVGIEVFSNILSFSEAEFIIDKIEDSSNSQGECSISWGVPKMHSPDISSLRRNQSIAISEHAFLNTSCTCGIREIDSTLGKIMLKCLEKYVTKYDIGITQDEGFYCVRYSDEHINLGVVDDNPFVNRILSMHLALNVDKPIEYINFKNIDISINISSPSMVIFPSNFIYSYEKPYHDGLYEIQNFFNNNPDQEYFENIFSEEVSVTSELVD